MTIDFEHEHTPYDKLTRSQQQAVVACAIKHIKNPDSPFYGKSFSTVCQTMAGNANGLRYLMRGKDPYEVKPKRRSRIFPRDTEVAQAAEVSVGSAAKPVGEAAQGDSDTFLERLERGEIQPQGAGSRTKT